MSASGAGVSRVFGGFPNAGTVNTGVTAVEHGDTHNHVTVLTVSQADALTTADALAIADGYLLYTFPAGVIAIDYIHMSMAMTAASAQQTADTPEFGLGTVIASGAVSNLGTPATFEDYLIGTAAADANGTALVVTASPTAAHPFFIASAAAHTLHFNVADTWGNDVGGDLTADIAGTVTISWHFLGS